MKKILFPLAFLGFLFSCENDTSTTVENNESLSVQNATFNVTPELAELRKQAFNEYNLGGEYYYSSGEGLTITGDMFAGETSTSIVIPPHALITNDGEEIEGYIYVDYVEVFTIEKMVSLNTPTVGFNTQTGEKDLLVSGGEFYLMIKDGNGNVVNLNQPIQVNIATDNSNANPNGMTLWNGITNSDGTFLWKDASTSDVSFANGAPQFMEGNTYNVFINNSDNFGWYNCDKFTSYPGPKTDMMLQIPSNFDATNSSVYIAFENEKNSLMNLYYDPNNNIYGFGHQAIPEGLNAHIIFVGEQNGQYVYEIISTVITGNPSFSVTPSNLTVAPSVQDLEQVIQQLP